MRQLAEINFKQNNIQHSSRVVPINQKWTIAAFLKSKNSNNYHNIEKDKHNKSTYDYAQDKIPPNFRIAKEHAMAMRIGPEIQEDPIRICKCCSRKLERQSLKMCCDQIDLAYIGSGYPLYFSFLKFCGAILLILLFSSGGYNLATNYYYGTTCQGIEQEVTTPIDNETTNQDGEIQQQSSQTTTQTIISNNCEKDWITMFSIGNKQDQKDLIMWQDILNFVSLILMIILFQLFRKYTKKLDQECDVADISAVDYTVLMKDIPLEYDALNNDYDDDIADYIENTFMEPGQVKVITVNLAYKMELLYFFKQEKNKIIQEKKDEIEYYHKHRCYKNYTLEELDQKMTKVQEQMDDLVGHFLEGKGKSFMKKYFTGWAFITVQTEEQKDKLLQKANESGGLFKRSPSVMYHGKKVNLEPAPDPTNVFWENLHIDNHSSREFRSYFLMLTWIFICFSIVWPLMVWQKSVSQRNEEEQAKLEEEQTTTLESLTNQLYLQATALTLSLVITILNAVSYNIIKILTDFERQWTRTLYNISAIKKLSLTQFIISAMITFLVEIFVIQQEHSSNFNKIFGSGGLVYNQSFVFILNSVVPFLTELIDFESIFKRILKNILYQNVDDGIPILYTQSELNLLFENPEFDIIRRYSDCLKTMYLCAFYSPIIPLGLIWSLLAIILHFWVDKYNLLRRRTIKHNMSSDLSREMTEMLEFVLIIYCLGNLIFWIFILGDYNNLSFWAVGGVTLGLLHAMLPMDLINTLICNVKEAPPNEQSIEEVQLRFLTDYARENPATAKQAKRDFLERKQSTIQTNKIFEAQNALTTNQTETDDLLSSNRDEENQLVNTKQKLKKTSFFMKKNLNTINENDVENFEKQKQSSNSSQKSHTPILKNSTFLKKLIDEEDTTQNSKFSLFTKKNRSNTKKEFQEPDLLKKKSDGLKPKNKPNKVRFE